MKGNKLFKYLAIGAGVLIVLAIIGKKTGIIGTNNIIRVTTAKIEHKTIVETVSANGKVQPEVEVKISPDVSGEIVELNVKEGDHVTKGMVLVRIKPNIYQSALEQAEAGLNTSKANLANSKARLVQSESQYVKADATYKRNKKLMDDGAISPSDFEAAKSANEVAKADVDAARESVSASDYGVKNSAANVSQARENLAKTTIIAPVDGTISKRNVEKGERVLGTTQMAGTEMMRIANLNEMEVAVDVNENDIIRVHLNDTALVEIDSYLNRKFKGIVTEIGNSANTTTSVATDQVTNFSVKVRILRESYADLIKGTNQSPFRPGMSATVDIQTKRAVDVLSVPIQAVTTRDTAATKLNGKGTKSGGGIHITVSTGNKEKEKKNNNKETLTECMFVLSEGKVKLKTVVTGIQDNNNIEIKSGLDEKDEVITGPYSAISKRLKEGDLVKVVSKDELYSDKAE